MTYIELAGESLVRFSTLFISTSVNSPIRRIMPGKRWIEEDLDRLKEDYSKGGASLAQERLPHRTIASICGQARKMGISAPPRKFKDLTGQVFNGNLVLRTFRENGVTRCECECYCGKIFIARATRLKSGHTKSCGCLQKQGAHERFFQDLTGQRFGRLVVIELDRIENWITYWRCLCDCGNYKVVRAANLKNGYTKSCGCYRIESGKRLAKENHLYGKCGKDSSHWKGEACKSRLQKRIYKSSKYAEYRKKCFKRDNYTCQYSGEIGKRLNMHHIKPFVQIWKENSISTYEEAMACEELWDLDNVITLAERYHMAGKENDPNSFHNLYDNHNCTKEDFFNWFLAIQPIRNSKE